jgi:alpha-L-arabinofuranosidase
VIDVVPAIDASGNTLSVMIANRHYGDKPMLARIGTKAFSSSKGRAYVLSGADPTACNTALTPDAIKMTEAVVKVGGEYALFEIPPYSVSAVILEK